MRKNWDSEPRPFGDCNSSDPDAPETPLLAFAHLRELRQSGSTKEGVALSSGIVTGSLSLKTVP
jgi:hypothetical protein